MGFLGHEQAVPTSENEKNMRVEPITVCENLFPRGLGTGCKKLQ
jgi:hypothetical protein